MKLFPPLPTTPGPLLLLSSLLSFLAPFSTSSLGPIAVQAATGRDGPSHFIIESPSTKSPWRADALNPLVWTYAKTSILQFDVELLRLSGTGLLLVAKNVPIVDGKAVIDVEGIPEGDDYFAIFMDSYDGTVFSRSSKFSIQSNNTASTSVEASLTMTITGAPNPTRAFETTLEALATTTTVGGVEYVASSAERSVAGLGGGRRRPAALLAAGLATAAALVVGGGGATDIFGLGL